MDQLAPVDRDPAEPNTALPEAVNISQTLTWSRASDLPEVVAAIDAVGAELGPHADVEAVVTALHTQGLGLIHCIAGLMAIKDIPLGEAKWHVHDSATLADYAADRESAWAAMYEEVTNAPE